MATVVARDPGAIVGCGHGEFLSTLVGEGGSPARSDDERVSGMCDRLRDTDDAADATRAGNDNSGAKPATETAFSTPPALPFYRAV
jgi:hypothetical protein